MLFFAVNEGKVASVDHLVKDLGWNLIDKDKTMTMRHLANMVSGYARGEAPGAAWAYNDYGIKLYKLSVFDKIFNEGSANNAATKPNRLGALQFQDGSIFSSRGGYGLSTSPRDFARIGWFWANRGTWNGNQLIPKQFFDDYMKPGVPGNLPRTARSGSDYLNIGTDGGPSDQSQWGPGIYGFNWWFNARVGTSNNLAWPDAPADLFMANGHWNRELMVVIPSLGVVAAARGSWGTLSPGSASASMNRNLKLLADAVIEAPVKSLKLKKKSESNIKISPNPFVSSTNIQLSLLKRGLTSIRIFDVKGSHIQTLIERKTEPGYYSFNWEPRYINSGIYMAEIKADKKRYIRKLTKN
jgi:CubicO group peptidase (beta-lactamase class C family)